MISRNFIIYGLHLICVTAVTGAGLVNDICHTVWIREDITQKAAKLNCSDTAKVYDPKSQNGSYLMDDTGNWGGVVFACLCSCQLPSAPENGQILSKDRIYHGATLNYSCNEGYEKSIERKIVCYDGLLMTVSGYLEKQDFNIFTRQKSLPDWFTHDYDGKVFDLWVNESANWSVPDTELLKNQKVFQILKNETILKYYMCRGIRCMLGCVIWGKGAPDCLSLGNRDVECKRNLTEATVLPSSQGILGKVIGGVVGAVVGGVVVAFIIYKVFKIRNKKNKRKKPKKKKKSDVEKAEAPLVETTPSQVQTGDAQED